MLFTQHPWSKVMGSIRLLEQESRAERNCPEEERLAITANRNTMQAENEVTQLVPHAGGEKLLQSS